MRIEDHCIKMKVFRRSPMDHHDKEQRRVRADRRQSTAAEYPGEERRKDDRRARH
jgi:hypothetical protein